MKKERLKKLVLCALFASFISAVAPFTIPLGPIPFSFAVFAVLLCGALLSPALSSTAMMIYIALGAVGVPVFSGFGSGIAKIIGPTGGYLVTYPLMAAIIGISVKILKKRSVLSLAVGMTVALIVCYTAGTIWFCYLTKKTILQALTICVYPFAPFDVLKTIAAIVVALGLQKMSFFKRTQGL